MSFRRRNFPEVLDNLLTEIIGGVAAESHPFPPGDAAPSEAGPFEHALERPKAKRVVSVYGSRNGVSQLFRAGVDYELKGDGQTLRWLKDAQTPDLGTLVHVNYLREDSPPTLTDLQVGSVLRTLTESVALEIARLYAQLQAVYDAGFIDTATGSSLDKVVAVLGLERVRGNRAAAKVQFARADGTPGSITIAAGTRIIDARARLEYATINAVTMLQNQSTVTVDAEDLEPGNDPVDANVLNVLPVPIAGISTVTNPSQASRASADESDEALRLRAKSFLHGSERATLGAINAVLARQQIRADVVEVSDTPGLVRISPHASDLTPEAKAQLLADIEASRPAGVRVEVEGAVAPLAVDLDIRLQTQARLPEVDVKRAHAEVVEVLKTFFAQLPVRADASLNQLVGKILAVKGVEDVNFAHALVRVNANGVISVEERLDRSAGIIHLADTPTLLGELSIADSNLPTNIDVVVSFPAAGAVPDAVALQAAVAETLAYLNELSASTFDPNDAAEVQRRTLRLGKFLRALPLPGRSAASLRSFDDATPTPALPTVVDVAPMVVAVFVHLSSGLTKTLDDDVATYELSGGERLALANLQLSAV